MEIEEFRKNVLKDRYCFYMESDEKEIYYEDRDSGCGDPDCCVRNGGILFYDDYTPEEWKEMLELVNA